MKNEITFGLFCDSSRVESYKVHEGKLYKLATGEPYIRGTNIGNECTFGFWNYPVLFDGYFVEMSQGYIPDVEFDVIFAAIERDAGNFIKLRQLYPKAVIFATIKEMLIPNMNVRRYIAREADGCVSPYFYIDPFEIFGYEHDKYAVVPQPTNIKYLREHFYVQDKKPLVFDYRNDWAGNREGFNDDVFDKLYNDMRFNMHREYGRTFYPDPNQARDFINKWNHCKYILNTDPTPNFGQQATQAAALGVVMVGGNNDANHMLFHETAWGNVKDVTHMILELERNTLLYGLVANNALRQLEAFYSFEAVRNKILELI